MNINELLAMYEDVVSMADFKAKKSGEKVDKEVKQDGKKHIEIVDVTFKYMEGNNSISIIKLNQPYPYEEAQKKINELDYYTWNAEPTMFYGGYNKSDYIANILVDGEPDTYKGHIDFGDGKSNVLAVNIKYNMQHYLGDEYVIDAPDIPYDYEVFKSKYGTREENGKKFVNDNKQELPKGTDYSAKSIDEIAVGDIFFQSEYSSYSSSTYYIFCRVTKKTKSSVWLEELKTKKIKNVDYQNGRLEDIFYAVPSDEVSTEQRLYGVDYSKPFRLSLGYDNRLQCSQGSGYRKEVLYAWKGNAMKENYNQPSVYARLNEEFDKLLENDDEIVVTRCNNCFTYYNPDVKECSNCHTDAYLMDMTEADLEHQGIDIDKISIEEDYSEDIVTVVAIPLVTERLYNKLVNLLYGNKKAKNRDYEQQENVLNFLQKLEDNIPRNAGISVDLEDYNFTVDEINAIKEIVKEERVDESLNEEKEKLDIRELIEGYNFSIIKTRVPEIEVLKQVKGNENLFDAEEFEEEVGKPCFVLYDNVRDEIRAIFLGETLTAEISLNIAENLETFINDSIWEDVVENFIPDEDRKDIKDFAELSAYLKSHDTGVSEWEATVVEMIATANKDLFKEITDMKEEDFKDTFGINESLKENHDDKYPKMLTTLVKKCWYGNGRFARNGKWSIGLGGYDHGYEVYFDGDVICQIKPNNKVYFGRDEEKIKEICGYNVEQIMTALKEVEPELEKE